MGIGISVGLSVPIRLLCIIRTIIRLGCVWIGVLPILTIMLIMPLCPVCFGVVTEPMRIRPEGFVCLL